MAVPSASVRYAVKDTGIGLVQLLQNFKFTDSRTLFLNSWVGSKEQDGDFRAWCFAKFDMSMGSNFQSEP